MRVIFGYLLLLLFPLITIAQEKSDEIDFIRREFKRINSSKKLEKIDLYNDEFMSYTTDGGGQLTGFFEQGQLVKVVEWIGISYGVIITEYYYTENQLFFAYFKESKFKDVLDSSGEWIYFDTTALELKFEGRYYFKKNQLIRTLNKGKRVLNETFDLTEFINHEQTIAKIIRDLK